MTASNPKLASEKLYEMVKNMKTKKAALFDLDGTLIDSMWIWKNLLIDFLSDLDMKAPKHLLNEVTHMSIVQSSAYVQQLFQLPMTPEEILSRWRKMVYSSYAEKIKLKPYAKEYLYQLKKQDVQLAIATSCDHALCEICLRNNGVFDLFSTITYSDDVGKGKNYPDIYIECLRRLDCSPEDAMLFEDILVALRTGKNLGMYVVAVADKNASPDHLTMKQEADLFIHNFKELL